MEVGSRKASHQVWDRGVDMGRMDRRLLLRRRWQGYWRGQLCKCLKGWRAFQNQEVHYPESRCHQIIILAITLKYTPTNPMWTRINLRVLRSSALSHPVHSEEEHMPSNLWHTGRSLAWIIGINMKTQMLTIKIIRNLIRKTRSKPSTFKLIWTLMTQTMTHSCIWDKDQDQNLPFKLEWTHLRTSYRANYRGSRIGSNIP